MNDRFQKLMLILLCAAPLALVGCSSHEHPGESASNSASSSEHPGDGEASRGKNTDEHPGDAESHNSGSSQ